MIVAVVLDGKAPMLRKDSTQPGKRHPKERGYRNGKESHQDCFQLSLSPAAMRHGEMLQGKA